MTGGACAYLVSRYPSVTHTFVVGEVAALRAAGVRVETASIRRSSDAEVVSDEHRAERDRTRALLPVAAPRLASVHLRAFGRRPRGYLQTLAVALRSSAAGGRARLWQLFYFVEAILLWDWMREHELHHVHVHHANVSADVALLACRYANTTEASPPWTWSLTVHGPTELLDISTHKLAAKVADAAAVIAISDFAHSQIATVADSAHLEKVHTVRCGIDTATFRPRPRSQTHRLANVLCVAALSRRKGHRVLLDAMAELGRAGVDAELTLVGDGPERARLESRVDELGLAGSVHFLGAVAHERIPALCTEADVFCLPSFAEGVPTVLMEAMAMQLPVVATGIMGVPELVEHERNGLIVPPARADLLAAALARLLGDPELRTRFGCEGRARVEDDYERSRNVAQLHGVLRPLIDR